MSLVQLGGQPALSGMAEETAWCWSNSDMDRIQRFQLAVCWSSCQIQFKHISVKRYLRVPVKPALFHLQK